MRLLFAFISVKKIKVPEAEGIPGEVEEPLSRVLQWRFSHLNKENLLLSQPFPRKGPHKCQHLFCGSQTSSFITPTGPVTTDLGTDHGERIQNGNEDAQTPIAFFIIEKL